MIMIVGLGNPGKEYENTRHNAGWRFIDVLSQHIQLTSEGERGIELKLDKKFEAYVGKGRYDGEEVILVKPNTFMNLSGKAVRKIKDYFKIENEKIWVVSDELDVPLGKVRFKEGGSAGHNGIKSILNELGLEKIQRVRIGIGVVVAERETENPEQVQLNAEVYVLQRFGNREEPIIEKAIEEGVHVVLEGILNQRLDSQTISVL